MLEANYNEADVESINAERKATKATLAAWKAKVDMFDRQLFEATWQRVSWNDLEDWLKTNGNSDPFNNPKVCSLDKAHNTYCYLNSKQELVVGPYYHNDHFPRQLDVYVRRDLAGYLVHN